MADGLIILALAGLILTFYPAVRVELSYRPATARAYFGELIINEPLGLGIPAPDPSFSIVIPKIEAKAKIIANVDPRDQASYSQALKIGVAHAAGSGFPGMGETVWLFAHSTDTPWHIVRYNAVFYLLRKLEPEDEVIVFFAGKRFNYRVFEKKIVEASDTSFLENEGEERLVLQTCWPPGTSLKRLIVLAKPGV